uniref:Uncharacterized protein n=2 Tax=Meloidogyne enterolobii TaxID=390850 RepID=A0A6V7W2P3_MELEN|nr:unnamed protein product [Meloidogyne enterolobii]
MSNSFYVCLLSNTTDYPDNQPNKFRVHLPKPIYFSGDWVCGLHSISYPYSWPSTIGTLEEQWIDIHCTDFQGKAKVIRVPVPRGSHNKPEDLLNFLISTLQHQSEVLEASPLDNVGFLNRPTLMSPPRTGRPKRSLQETLPSPPRINPGSPPRLVDPAKPSSPAPPAKKPTPQEIHKPSTTKLPSPPRLQQPQSIPQPQPIQRPSPPKPQPPSTQKPATPQKPQPSTQKPPTPQKPLTQTKPPSPQLPPQPPPAQKPSTPQKPQPKTTQETQLPPTPAPVLKPSTPQLPPPPAPAQKPLIQPPQPVQKPTSPPKPTVQPPAQRPSTPQNTQKPTPQVPPPPAQKPSTPQKPLPQTNQKPTPQLPPPHAQRLSNTQPPPPPPTQKPPTTQPPPTLKTPTPQKPQLPQSQKPPTPQPTPPPPAQKPASSPPRILPQQKSTPQKVLPPPKPTTPQKTQESLPQPTQTLPSLPEALALKQNQTYVQEKIKWTDDMERVLIYVLGKTPTNSQRENYLPMMEGLLKKYSSLRKDKIDTNVQKQIIDSISLYFHNDFKRFKLEFSHPNIKYLSFSPQLGYVLGFENTNMVMNEEIAKYGSDLRGGFSSFAVYSRGLTENMIVGNSLSSLLRVVSVSGATPGEYHEKIYDSPIFIRVLPKEINEIEIELRTMDGGRLVPFAFGTVMIVLIFKKVINF